jgi:FkbM family methyltransferase
MGPAMNRFPRPGYRALFWFVSSAAIIATASLYYARSRALQLVGDPRFYDPQRLSALRDVNYPFTIEVYGYKYRGRTGDYIDDHVLAFGAYEKDVLFFMRDYLRARNNPDAVFLDVGACEGQHSLFVSRLVKQVHAFEPFPPAIARFKGLIELNGFTNIHLHEVGLGAGEAVVPFHAPDATNQGSGSFVSDGMGAPSNGFRVIAGDILLGPLNLPSIDLIKIDVEGYEEPVLKGLSTTLQRHRPVLVVEVTHPPFGTIGTLRQLEALLPPDYGVLHIHEHGDAGLDAITGKYSLTPVVNLYPAGSDIPSKIIMVVAYPKERERLIPRK